MTVSTLPSRPLGRSGLMPSALGFGGAPLGDLYARLDEATATATVEAALAAGVSLIDTSPLYGHGLSEHRIGAALRRSGRKDVVISTKVGRVAEPFAGRGDGSGYLGGLPHSLRFDYSYDGAMRSLEQSALRLGVDRLDIVLIHDVDVWTHGADRIEARFAEAMDGAYRALERLRSAGAVKAIGVGVNEAEMCERFARAGDFDAMLLAGRYSLLEQPALASFMPLALEKGIGLMLGGVFNSGILATGPVPGARYNYRPAPPEILARVAAIEAICARHGVPLRRAALQFPLGHPAVSSLVMGAVTPAEVVDQIAELSAPIPVALWGELKAEGLLGADVPVPG
ncbi:MAG TPA: aldo/keto reductase [Bosea sp. (in: a-proteobacteria)]|uniref:aldo/keto reductase n=1 Tax=Bosea sp. (in: a-proteobacteria) TaxID=1871050 RepID=UPI002E100D04|nr:aldo/keto reductase [Bosea sp. (in: a-proteobacteria)]